MEDLRLVIGGGEVDADLMRLTQRRLVMIADRLGRVGDRKRAVHAARELEGE